MLRAVTAVEVIILVMSVLAVAAGQTAAGRVQPVVEVEEDLYSYTPSKNGSGPLWCSGSTCLVRHGQTVFATEVETLKDVPPLNNCRWRLHRRDPNGWRVLYTDQVDRTREPCPMAVFDNGHVWVSANPTLVKPAKSGGGPARPELFGFRAADAGPAEPERLVPEWEGRPRFTEHSYRSFAADGTRGELIIFQNIGYTHAEWTFRNSRGRWQSSGRLKWPWGKEYDKPQPIRVCYPNVALKNRAVYFCGVSDIIEPYSKWRAYKQKLTGRKWDYDFRRLFFTWTPDITREPFSEWVEVASRDRTGGWILPCDLWVAPDGTVHILWHERAIDERLRKEFFPSAKQSRSINYAVVDKGKVILRKTLLAGGEAGGKEIPRHRARLHATKDGRLFAVYYLDGKTRLQEIGPGGALGQRVAIPLKHAFMTFFTATPRGGSPESDTLDLLGYQAGKKANVISYARIRLKR